MWNPYSHVHEPEQVSYYICPNSRIQEVILLYPAFFCDKPDKADEEKVLDRYRIRKLAICGYSVFAEMYPFAFASSENL